MFENLFGYVRVYHDSFTYRILAESLALGWAILPGLVVGLLVSSALVAWWPVEFLKHWSPGWTITSILLMAAAGVISPFCSYLAVPIAAALIQNGVTPAPVVAFLCATPLMNPTLFGMTLSALGWSMALARMFSALGMGIIGGLIALYYTPHLTSLIRNPAEEASKVIERKSSGPFLSRWQRSFLHMGSFTLKYVGIGILLAAAFKELLPMEWVEAIVGRQYGYGILCGAVLGVPLYACGGGTIPLIDVLMNKGMSPGAALAFFISGPATKPPILMTMKLTLGTALTVAYVILNIVWAILAGALFQLIYAASITH
ncbi:MAG: hypothetical protein GC154_21205 [bacterium]|nr:hypothetical protein [bacterium]